MKGYFSRLLSFVALFAMAVYMLPVGAAGVALTTIPSNGEINSAAATGLADVYAYWTSSATYQSGDSIIVSVNWSEAAAPSSTASALVACTSTIFGGGTVNFSSASQLAGTFTFTANATTTGGGICVSVPVTTGTDGTLGTKNFSLAVLSGGTAIDYGATMFYVNGGNDVLVTATVPATLQFMITSSTNLTVEKHTCDLGELTSVGVNTCDYRLKVATTNAQGGFQITIQGADDFGSGFATFTAFAENGTVTAGSEHYAIRVVGATTGGRNTSTGLYTEAVTENGDFNDDDTPVPTTSAQNIISYDDGFYVASYATTATTLITHAASASFGTPAGQYSQLVTYYITASF